MRRREIYELKRDTQAKYLAAANYRSKQHQRAKESLNSAFYWVRGAQIITMILALVLVVHVFVSVIINYKIFKEVSKYEIFRYISPAADTRVGSVITSMLSFAVSIPAQRTFPAPWRSFIGTFIFAFKQLLDIFLPVWFVVALPVFGFIALATLNQDREKQVRIDRK
jgi:uncharacterized membrane protein